MQSKKLSSDLTIIKKDLTRYAPVWCGLCAVMILAAIATRDEFKNYGANELPYFPFAIYFAPVSALAVFGYLHNHTESCAVHALPIRRERLFLLHTLSAFLMYVIPMTVFLIVVDPWCVNSVISMLLWSVLEFVWLFSIAAMCMMITGRKIGAALLYIFIQVVPMLIGSIVELIYLPELPGVYIDSYAFLVSPTTLVASIPELNEDGVLMTEAYLATLVMVGLTLALYGVCLMMYRMRHMERSGDLLSVKWLDPVFAVCSAVTGIFLMQVMFNLDSDGFDLTLFLLGTTFGYLSYWMLSKKSARVFTPKIIGGLLALVAVLVGSVYVTGMDPFGRVTYFPEVKEVKTATICQSYYGHNQYETSDPEQIAALIELHTQMLDDHMAYADLDYYSARQEILVGYELENGSMIHREYIVYTDSLLEDASWYFSQPIAQFGTDDPQLTIYNVEYKGTQVYLDRDERAELNQLVLEECKAGTMHEFQYQKESDWRIIVTDQSKNNYYLDVPLKAETIINWLEAHYTAE